MKNLFRYILGGIFLYAGAIKAWSPSNLFIDITNYQIVSSSVALGLALYLPWVEIVCGLCLVAKRLYPAALMILMVLMGVFMVALVSAWVRGLDVRCGCFGNSRGSSNYPIWLLRDFTIFFALIWTYLKGSRAEALT